MKIVVIGGSGLIGTKLVNELRQKGHEVVAASPTSGVNTITGEGLAEALAGAQVVVDVANSPSFEDERRSGVLRDVGAQPARRGSGRRRRTSRGAVGRRHRPASRERLPPREDGPGEPDQGLRDSLHDRPRHAVLRVRGRHRPVRHRRANGSPVAGPAAAHRVRRRGRRPGRRHARRAGERHDRDRRTGTRCRSTNSSGDSCAPTQDPREVIADTHARYFGTELDDRSLTPGTTRASARPASTTGSAIRRRSDKHRRRCGPVQRHWPHPTIPPVQEGATR